MNINFFMKFLKLVVVGNRSTQMTLRVKSSIIPKFFSEHIRNDSLADGRVNRTDEYHFLFKIEVRECIIGEIYRPDENICYPCPEHYYSQDTKDVSCHTCPDNANCSGRNKINVKEGYWRKSINSTDIYMCNVVSNPCEGGFESKCKKG